MPDQEKIHQLFADCVAGNLSEEDSGLMEQLLSTDEGIRKQWTEYMQAFEDTSSRQFLQKIDADRAWLSVSKRIVEEQATVPRQRSTWMFAAAALVLLTIGGLGYYFSNMPTGAKSEKVVTRSDVVLKLWNGEQYNLLDSTQGTALIQKAATGFQASSEESQRPGVQQDAFSTISVPATMDYHLVLPDGSEVWLNSSSVLQIPASFQTDSREVFLIGEAYFKVANQADAPFTVHTDSLDIQVLGTEFNVNTFDGRQTVASLFSGAVEAWVGDDRIQLSPGHEAVASADGLLSREFDRATVAAWRTGVYYFDNESLERLLPVLERWYGVQIRIADPSLATTNLSGAIHKSDSVTVFLENLKTTANIRYQISDKLVLLSSATNK